MINMKLYVTEDDYKSVAGDSWPAYENFLNGERSDIPAINSELTKFIDMSLSRGIKFPINTKTACQSKWYYIFKFVINIKLPQSYSYIVFYRRI